jgi:predicted RNA-binding protein (virulence factor B family)
MSPFDLLGCRVTLRIVRFADAGAYLGLDGAEAFARDDDRDRDDADDDAILLPRGEVPPDARAGDALRVFIYLDSEDRPIATLRVAKLALGEVTFLEITACTSIGAFVDWGLGKELLVPFAEQSKDLYVGERQPLGLYIDNTGRLAATMFVSDMLDRRPRRVVLDEWVEGEAWRNDPDVGLFVIVERAFVGLVPASEPHRLRRGDATKFRVAAILDDGKIVLSLRQHAYQELAGDAARVLDVLSAANAPRVGDAFEPRGRARPVRPEQEGVQARRRSPAQRSHGHPRPRRLRRRRPSLTQSSVRRVSPRNQCGRGAVADRCGPSCANIGIRTMKPPKLATILGACVLAYALPAAAAVIFHNTGTTAGWDSTNHEHNGSIFDVTNVVYEGPTAIKATQIFDPSYTGRYHSEVVKENVYHRGDTGFYGFMFRLQNDWQFENQSYNIAQFIADFSDTGCDDFMPSSMVWIEGNQLFTRVKQGTVCAQKTVTFGNLATITAGEWHKIEIQAKWATDGTGFYKLWYDGVKVLEKFNINTTVADDRFFQMRVGIYANGWHDDGGMLGSQGTRSIWFDEIGVGTTFADADADQW